jgi:hypothetical protein
MKNLVAKALVVVLVLGIAPKAFCEGIAFDISGNITGISGDSSLLSGTGIQSGSTFTGIFVYDSEAIPESSQEGYAIYGGDSYSITIDGFYFVESTSPKISVTNDYDNPVVMLYTDGFAIGDHNNETTTSNLPTFFCTSELKLVNVSDNSSLPPFSSTDLPTVLTLQDFVYRLLTVNFGVFDMNGTIQGEITSIAPASPPDSDSDGVYDPADECPNTPEGAIVYSNGCMKGDMDNDGNVDGEDLSIFSQNYGL